MNSHESPHSHLDQGPTPPNTIDTSSLSREVLDTDFSCTVTASEADTTLPDGVRAISLHRRNFSTKHEVIAAHCTLDLHHKNTTDFMQNNYIKLLRSYIRTYTPDVGSSLIDRDPEALYVAFPPHPNLAVRLALSSTEQSSQLTIESVPSRFFTDQFGHLIEQTEFDTPADTRAVLDTVINGLRMALDTFQVSSPSRDQNNIYALHFKPDSPVPPAEELCTRTSSLDELGGLFEIKQQLRSTIDKLRPGDSISAYDTKPANILISGTTGTGKTSLITALAHDADATLLPIKLTATGNVAANTIEQKLENLVLGAWKPDRPTIAFIDYAESWIGIHTASSAVYTEKQISLLRFMDTLRTDPRYVNVIIAAATDWPLKNIEKKFYQPQRMSAIEISLPTRAERTDIWVTLMTTMRNLTDATWENGRLITSDEQPFVPLEPLGNYSYEEFATRTVGWSGAQIKALLTSLCSGLPVNTQISNQDILNKIDTENCI